MPYKHVKMWVDVCIGENSHTNCPVANVQSLAPNDITSVWRQCSRIQYFGIIFIQQEEVSTFHPYFFSVSGVNMQPAHCKHATTEIRAEFAWEQHVCIRSVATHSLLLCCIENNEGRSDSFIPSKWLICFNSRNQHALVYLTLPEFLLYLT